MGGGGGGGCGRDGYVNSLPVVLPDLRKIFFNGETLH